MAALDQWNASTLKLDRPEDARTYWNPDEPNQFFWIDDAFGVSQYESDLVYGWNRSLPYFKPMLAKGTKIVMTSRDYVYNRARKDLKMGAFPLLSESQVVIDVHELTPEEKRQILYNHLKLGKQPRDFLTRIKPWLEGVAVHPRFVPETARRLGDPVFTKGMYLSKERVEDFVERQEQLLIEVLQALDSDCRAALALIYMRKGELESPIHLEQADRRALTRLGSSLGGCTTSLESLNGSLVHHRCSGGASEWRFKHPTVGDALATQLVRNPELLEIYIHGSQTSDLIDQVTCGDVGLERAIIIPHSLYALILRRLDDSSLSSNYKSPSSASWDARRRVINFLARRCSKEFLSLYLAAHPDVLDEVAEPGLMLSAASEVDLAIKLHTYGLLPEPQRMGFLATVTAYAVSGEDLYALEDENIRSMFTEEEFMTFRHRLRTELVPVLSEVRYEWESNFRGSNESADGYMEPLLSGLQALTEEFSEDESLKVLVDEQAARVNEWIDEQSSEEFETPRRALGDFEARPQFDGTRSIFDDLDA